MTSALGRIWAVTIAVVIFSIFLVVLEARPWVTASAGADPRLVALQARETRLQAQAISVGQTLNNRWSPYRTALLRQGGLSAQQRAALQAAPAGPSVIVKVTGARPVTHSTSSTVATSVPASIPSSVQSSVPAPAAGN